MQNIGDKANSTAGSTGELTAEEFNDHKNELQKLVTSSGQNLSASLTPDQLSRGAFVYGAGAGTVLDSGSGDSIILSPLTGASGLLVPDTLAPLSGCVLSFKKTTPNLTTAVTVNFGQTGTELGAKTLVRPDGSAPQPGDVNGECLIRYDLSNDRWVLLRNGGGTFIVPAVDTDIINPVFEGNSIIVDTSLGDATITLGAPIFLGQKVNITADGSGILEVNGGNGIYVNSIFVNETADFKGCARAEAVDDGVGGLIWQFVNEISANYYDGTVIWVEKWTKGKIVQKGKYIASTSSNTNIFTYNYPEAFLTIESAKISAWGNNQNNTRISTESGFERRYNESFSLTNVDAIIAGSFADGSGSTAGYGAYFEIKGKY